MNQDDQRRRRGDAKALLRRPSWNDEDIDHATALHDLLETPDGEPDPAAAALRGVYRFRTRRSGCDLQFGRQRGLRQDRGSWLFVCST